MFSRFMQLTKLAVEAEQKKEKDRFTLAAFIGFQMGAAGENKTFGDYLARLGLLDDVPRPAGPQDTRDDTDQLKRMGIEVKKVKKV